MILYGLTGGIGMGKSVAETILLARGIPVIDTDKVSRQLVEPGQPALAEITALFGGQILDESGCLRRTDLAALVFGNPGLLKKLEAILHPRIREYWQAEVRNWRETGVRCGVVSIPLLFETEAQSAFGKVLCIACSAPSQRQRLLRRGWTEEAIEKRISSQMPVTKKMELSHHVIWSEGSLEVHEEQLRRILALDGVAS